MVLMQLNFETETRLQIGQLLSEQIAKTQLLATRRINLFFAIFLKSQRFCLDAAS